MTFFETDRERITAFLSVPEAFAETAVETFGETLAAQYGGASISLVNGFWADDGANFQKGYSGTIQREVALRVELLVCVGQADGAIDLLQLASIAFKKTYLINLTWVHVELGRVSARHFQLQRASGEAHLEDIEAISA